MGKWIRTDQAKAQLLAEQVRLVNEALEGSEPTTPMRNTGPPTSSGDRLRMRHVPIQAIGVGGTLPGTQPLEELLRRERRHSS